MLAWPAGGKFWSFNFVDCKFFSTLDIIMFELRAENQRKVTRKLTVLSGIIIMLFITGCDEPAANKKNESDSGAIISQLSRSEELAHKYIIIDTHIDTPYWLEQAEDDIDIAQDVGNAGEHDFPKAKKGGLDGGFMSIYIPAVVDEAGKGWPLTLKLIDRMRVIADHHPDKFALAPEPQAILENHKKGLISLPMGMENGGPLSVNTDSRLAVLHKLGVSYVGLAHSKNNAFADSSYDSEERWGGLSKAGKKLVHKLNDIGIMIDVSHLSDKAFYDVLEESKVPVIASHSSLRHFIPDFHRNLDDAAIVALAKNGGVIQINFGSTFVSNKSRHSQTIVREAVENFMVAKGHASDSEEVALFRKDLMKKYPFQYATLDDVLDHFDYVKTLVGVDYLGIGSDFNGVGDTLPEGLKNVADYPNLIQGLIDRGYSEQEIEKILGGNLLRVWNKVVDYAK